MTERKRTVQVTGYVWCDMRGEIHDDTLNPYNEEKSGHCSEDAHRPVFIKAYPSEGDF